MSLSELKSKGVTIVILNGWKEKIGYVMSLSEVNYEGVVKSDDGYSEIHCYTSN